MNEVQYRYPEAIVSGDWLESHLDDPDLRVFDCTTHLVYEEGSGQPYSVVSGRADYDGGHIPGSGFLDLQESFARQDSPYRFTLPTVAEAANAFGRHGITDGIGVVLYARKSIQWATRFWWMLRWLGFDRAAILNGGYDKWLADGRAVSTEPSRYPAGRLTAAPRPETFVGRDTVLKAIGQSETCTINALLPDLHSGRSSRYGRPGRVPGSVNVPAASLLTPESMEFVGSDKAQEAFAAVGAEPAKRVIAYCGGGIAATLDAFLMHQLGFRDIAVYDNSMSEWAKDETLPIETD